MGGHILAPFMNLQGRTNLNLTYPKVSIVNKNSPPLFMGVGFSAQQTKHGIAAIIFIDEIVLRFSSVFMIIIFQRQKFVFEDPSLLENINIVYFS